MLIKAGDIISKSIALYRENWKLFFSYILLFFIPTGVFQIIVAIMDQRPDTLWSVLFIVAMMVLLVLVNIWFSVAFVRAIARRYTGQDAKDVRSELETAKPLFWPAVLASILAGLIILGGMILFIIPGIIFSIWYAFVLYAVALDNNTATGSLKASKDLVTGRWWSVFWRLLAPGFVFGFLAVLLQWIVGFSTYLGVTFGLAGTIISLLLITFAGLLAAPLSSAAPTILYLELKKTPKQVASPPQPAAKA